MNKLGNKVCLILIFMVMYSCFSNKYEYKGKKRLINKEDWIVKIYQFDEFEMITSIDYEIVNEDGQFIMNRQGLGGDSNIPNVDNFYVKMQDSIFYICYPYPKVIAIKHISNMDKQNQWDLIEKLKKQDSSLCKKYK
ncbi:hypothetical protein ACE1MK_11070 [Tenacibaculum maritimum]|uniref:hypothetical protein n=1 Tax=Tenacibaculum maritimum TaxID=107401 RepID=UPI0012E5BEC4|nr:hypothetical protein [Tenacibaculum maritimum]MCD9580777.1 hypothetical protein [Tenacibaculum maritimum]MCD9635051.1 hypothetical protein [Tenacibaculum maritimum]CAA0250996.1 hypothetical protein USCSE301_70069 [Tenacibaculum maritimum]CAA0258085.1 hypothetical protein USCSP91_90025 [Tenacibaculum maritimum]